MIIKTDNSKVILHLQEQLKKAEEVIKFYADDKNHKSNCGSYVYLNDEGEKAKKYFEDKNKVGTD